MPDLRHHPVPLRTVNLLKCWGKAAAFAPGRIFAGRLQPRHVILCYYSVHPNRPFLAATPEHVAVTLCLMMHADDAA